MTDLTRVTIAVLVSLTPLAFAPGCAGCQRPQPGPSPSTGGVTGTGGYPATGGTTATGGQSTGGTAPSGGTAGTGGVPADDCEAAEWRIRDLDCRHDSDGGPGKPRWLTPSGTPLSVVCRDRAADNDPICPACLMRIKTCDGIEACRPLSPGVCP
jgi:hypothetical protein